MLSKGAIIGIAVGTLAATGILICLLIRCLKRGERLPTVTHHKNRNVVTEKPSNVRPDILVTIHPVDTTTTVTPRSALAPASAAPKPKGSTTTAPKPKGSTTTAPKPKPTSSYTPKKNYKSSSPSGYRSGEGGYTSTSSSYYYGGAELSGFGDSGGYSGGGHGGHGHGHGHGGHGGDGGCSSGGGGYSGGDSGGGGGGCSGGDGGGGGGGDGGGGGGGGGD